MNHDEIEALEEEFAARLGAPLHALRASRAHCPPLQMLRAAGSESLPEEQSSEIENHLRGCVLCRTLASDLQNDELTQPTWAEAQRIRARVDSEADSKRVAAPRPWAWMARPALAAAAVALLVWGGWMALRETAAPVIAPQPRIVQHAKKAPIPAALELEMPEVRLRAAIVLVTRGAGDSQQYLKDLAGALEAYRAGDYTAAARQFAALEPKYPRGVEALFYGGVSRLHEGANDAAVASLERAQALNEREFRDETGWYLGLAYHRAGKLDAARAQFERLCAGTSDFAARACDAAREMSGAVSR